MFRTIVKTSPLTAGVSAIILASTAASALARGQGEPTRADTIVAEQQKKSSELTKYEGTKAEQVLTRIETTFITGMAIHPFFESALAGGGFTLGAGYRRFLGSYDTLDVRGSITLTGYKQIEAEFLAPRLFKRRGVSVIGGWREATQVGFYGKGTANTSVDDRANSGFFDQPYLVTSLDYRPTRRYLVLGATADYSQWRQGPGSVAPSVDEVYTPATLPRARHQPDLPARECPGRIRLAHLAGLHAHRRLLRRRGAPRSRRAAGLQAGQLHRDPAHPDPAQYLGVVAPRRGRNDSARRRPDGSRSSCCRRSAAARPCAASPAGASAIATVFLMSADFRILANNFFDMALFYDAGKVASDTGDLNFDGLKSD